MREKMLVTQALDERDLLVKKISDKIDKASFVDTIKTFVVCFFVVVVFWLFCLCCLSISQYSLSKGWRNI